ncbi:MAG: PIG-L family deacetylase [Ilumatobacteraceae bacterium]|jgi:LmbE family N-acetylglucosaminyl deacetylase
MATLVCFHAHPDDEVISTGGTIARAAAEGHRVVLVVATNGDHGEVPDDLGDDESLVDRRRAETEASAAALGISRIAWLGYSDSGMTGWEQNADPASFHRADPEEAGARLAEILREESADVLTIYDWHGNYGHPDHVAVYRAGLVAERLVPSVRVLQATMNRDAFVRMIEAVRESGALTQTPGGADVDDFDPNGPADDGNPMGMPEAEITLAVDVSDHIAVKRAAMRCHRSQIEDTSFFLEMPDEAFVQAFGVEWFIEHDGAPPHRVGWVFDPLDRSS